jgi:transcriptional regulator with GAF, ATPase, and Fis domain
VDGVVGELEAVRAVFMEEAPKAEADVLGTLPARREDEIFPGVFGKSEALRALYAAARTMAATGLPVLIHGETGAGKERLAEALHQASRRAHGPFMRVNCASMQDSLIESKLFGHAKGAFTGAASAHSGLFVAAHGGTLHLDEVGELSAAAQAKLLRAIETQELTLVGSTKPRRVDVRIVASTNRELFEECRNGRFRSDLDYRLSGATLTVPPLRDRPEDIAVLARAALRETDPSPVTDGRLTAAALDLLERYPWPGNVRELRHGVARACTLAAGGPIEPRHFDLRDGGPADGERGAFEHQPLEHRALEHRAASEARSPIEAPYRRGEGSASRIPAASHGMPPHPTPAPPPLGTSPSEVTMVMPASTPDTDDVFDAIRQDDRQELVAALRKCRGNQSAAAELLGISRFTLMKRMDRLGIRRPSKGRTED